MLMRKYDIEVNRIEGDIVSRLLYDYRNKVLHRYIPTDKELSYIVNVVPKFIQVVKEFRQKHP